jgi:hypothetical protein
MRSVKRAFVLVGVPAVLATVGFGTAASASVLETIGNWSADPGFQTGETVNTNTGAAPVVTTTGGQSDGLIAGFSPTTLSPGDTLTFSGTILFPSADTGGVQFRIGLMNTNGTNPATTDTGWLGYLAEIPNSTDGLGNLGARSSPATGAWLSGTGLTNLAGQTGTSPHANAPGTPTSENFTLTLVYNGSGPNTFSDTMISNDGPPATFNLSASGTDPATGDSGTEANTLYNEVGFFFGSSTFGSGGGQTTFSNLAVTYTPAVPEPASAAVLGLGSLSLLARRRRSKAE